MAFIDDPREEIKKRIRELKRGPILDEKELTEREEAAEAYAGENPKHFVDYCHDCINTSRRATEKIRQMQKECFSVYNEEAPPNYAKKESWQSRVITPKPHGAVQFAMAAVRKAFSTDFLSIENEINKPAAEFWEKLAKHQLNRNHANFPIQFTDATGMSFAIGQSLEMIPVWRPGRGLKYILTEPWKISRDPDAISRHPQSGMYWIHREYIDYYVLKEGEKSGKYFGVDRVKDLISETAKEDINLSKEEIARKKEMVWHRSKYRKMPLISEFWGTVLDSKANLLLPSCTYTIAEKFVIGLPKRSPYKTLRWPGISFSPLPHFLRYDGRGLLQGVKSLWYYMCNLMTLHIDNLNWVVNPQTEYDLSAFIDQEDIDNIPGKQYLTRGTVSGNQAVRTVDRKNTTSEVLANMQYGDQLFDAGTFVTPPIQGLPGHRSRITAKEVAQNLEQSMTVFALIAKNIEDGAIQAIEAGAETIEANIGIEELLELFPMKTLEGLVIPDEESPTGIRLPELGGSYHVSGISAVMRDIEIIKNITETVIPMCTPGSVFLPYLKPYNIIKSVETRLNLKDEGIVVDEETAAKIDMTQQVQQEREIEQEGEIKESEGIKALREAIGETQPRRKEAS
jgi:hypothetical protein